MVGSIPSSQVVKKLAVGDLFAVEEGPVKQEACPKLSPDARFM